MKWTVWPHDVMTSLLIALFNTCGTSDFLLVSLQ